MNSLLYLKVFLKRIVFLIGIYTTSRLYLLLNNLDSFYNPSFWDFLEGIRFDFSAVLYINIPILILLLFPTNFRTNKSFHKFINIIFYGLNIPFIILNNVDIEYFRFTQKRSTTDLFQLLQLGNDAKNIIPQYLKDFWPITLFTILQVWLLMKIKNIPNARIIMKTKSILSGVIVLLFGASVFIFGARGGLQLKPIKSINAGELFGSNNYSLILNTPFCLFHSYGDKQLKTPYYFTENKLDSIYNPFHHFKDMNFQKKNVIILIIESLSREFIGAYNNRSGYTPFLDSLMSNSLVYENAFANGLKSIEALPAITASIPTLMNNPFISSNYAQNSFESLASLLRNEGYNTSFYHGGSRGTMGFYSFSRKVGFTDYFGMEEYNNNADFDGCWGVYDKPFLQYFSDHLKEKEEPFFTTLFTLSSHPPYTLPDDYSKVVLNDYSQEIGILETIQYTDYAIAEFFKKAKKEEWYHNTFFIITADHTSPLNYDKRYKNKIGRYAIPLFIFSGDSSLQGNRKNIVQQIDILPTTLELLGYNKPFFAFGKSMFSDENWALSYLQNNYSLITNNGILINKGEYYQLFKDWNLTKELQVKEEDLIKLKAIKQRYTQRMINNKLMYED